MNLELITTCIGAKAYEIDEYDATERLISYRTMLKHVGADGIQLIMKDLGYDFMHIKDDWAVKFGKGRFRNRTVYCVHWSAIHHFYAEDKQYGH